MSRILLLLEAKENRRLLAETLAPHYEIIQPRSEDALDEEFDLCILDGRALDRLWARVHKRKQESAPAFLPFLLVTPRRDVGKATRYLWKVIDELIISPIEKIELRARIDGLLLTRQLSLDVYAKAVKDALTGLYNRAGFFTLAEQYLLQARREKRHILLLFLDLDDLKAINDQFGHLAGDAALVETATVLRATFRESDVIARLGGDEFVVLALGQDDAALQVIQERLQKTLRETNARAEHPFSLSFSTGALSFSAQENLSIDQMLAAADQAMYIQKRKKHASTQKSDSAPVG